MDLFLDPKHTVQDHYTKGIPLPRILNYCVPCRDSRLPRTTYQEAIYVDYTQQTPSSFSDPTHATQIRLPNSIAHFKHALWLFYLSTL
jgi:hypothetical protein